MSDQRCPSCSDELVILDGECRWQFACPCYDEVEHVAIRFCPMCGAQLPAISDEEREAVSGVILLTLALRRMVFREERDRARAERIARNWSRPEDKLMEAIDRDASNFYEVMATEWARMQWPVGATVRFVDDLGEKP